MAKPYNQSNIKYKTLIQRNCVHFKEKEESLIASNLHVPEPQSVMIPIPNVLVTDGDKEVLKFIKNIGLISS